MPTCTILAGPNGSGKTSAFGKLNLEGEYINADEIAKTLPPGGSKGIDAHGANARKRTCRKKGRVADERLFKRPHVVLFWRA
jgi:predicted ABC-type ATPase